MDLIEGPTSEPIRSQVEHSSIKKDSPTSIDQSTSTSQTGRWTALLQKATKDFEVAQGIRRSIGGALSFDSAAFDHALNEERTKQSILTDTAREIREASDALLFKISKGLAEHQLPIKPSLPEKSNSHALAIWLDESQDQISEILALLDQLQQRSIILSSYRSGLKIIQPVHAEPYTLPLSAITDEINSAIHSIDVLISESEHWRNRIASIVAVLSDCSSPRPSSSLAQIDMLTVLSLTERSKIDNNLDPLLPFLFRQAAELGAFNDPDSISVLLEHLKTTFDRHAKSKDWESYQELISFLPLENFETLFCYGDRSLSRHVLLAGLRESLARRSDFFFNELWPLYARHKKRTTEIGEHVVKLFDSLQSAFWRTGSLWPVLPLIKAKDQGQQNSTEVNRFTTAERIRATKQLTTKLSTVGMSGYFHRLRHLASAHIFKPLLPHINDGQLRALKTELHELRCRFESGELEQKIFELFGEQRNIREDHRTSLHRYIKDHLELVQEWVLEEEEAWQSVNAKVFDDEFIIQLHHSIDRLAIEDDQSEEALHAGSREWLEHHVAKLMQDIALEHFPLPSFSFYGALPLPESLFPHPPGLETFSWPAWVDNSPSAERLWVQHIKGTVEWKDAFQDCIAQVLLNRSRTQEETLSSFIEAREWDATAAAARYWNLTSPEAMEFLRKAESLSETRSRIDELVELTDKSIMDLKAKILSPDMRTRLNDLESRLVSLYAEADSSSDLHKLLADVQGVAENLSQLEKKVVSSESIRKQQIEQLQDWLRLAQVPIPLTGAVADLERLAAFIREREKSRRAHLITLKEIDTSGNNDDIRHAARHYLSKSDRPDIWPTPLQSENAQLYLEYLKDLLNSWRTMLKSLDSQDITLRRINSMSLAIAQRLEVEIDAILNDQIDKAVCLNLIQDRHKNIPELYSAFLNNGLVEEPATGPLRLRSFSQEAHAIEQAEAYLATLIPLVTETAEGRHVNEAFVSFGRGTYKEAIGLASLAIRRLGNEADTNKRRAILSILGCSLAITSETSNQKLWEESLGLLFHEFELIRERSSLEVSRPMGWLICAATDKINAIEEANSYDVARFIKQIADFKASNKDRERFASILRIAGPSRLAIVIWDQVRGLKEETTKAHVALLEILYDLGEDASLNRLFTSAGENHKYLSAFVALSRRALLEPSRQLGLAIQQNLNRINTIREKAFRTFTANIAARLQYISRGIQLEADEALEKHIDGDAFSWVVTVIPDESDPPLSITLELLETDDFVCAPGESPIKRIDALLFERKEFEYVIKPKDILSASNLAVLLRAETASGQPITFTKRFQARIASHDSAGSISDDDILEAYTGWDGRPVTGSIFIGRESELEILRHCVGSANPGGVVVYGSRRIGKTSLLQEFKRRSCFTRNPRSDVFYWMVPVDEFSVADSSSPFLDRFLRHIWHSLILDRPPYSLESRLRTLGVTGQELENVGRLPDKYAEASFLTKLREYSSRIKQLTEGRIKHVVLMFDEFDKLLEQYYSGNRANVEELTNQLRKAASQERDIGVVIAGSELLKHLTGDPRNALYGSITVLGLECFQGEKHFQEAKSIVAPEMLHNRRVFVDSVISEIIRLTGGHPFYMKLVACASARSSTRQRVSQGTVLTAIQSLLKNEIFPGYLPDVQSLVMQPLQVLHLLPLADKTLCELLLYQVARHSTLERPLVHWSNILRDDRLLNLCPADKWVRLREKLRDLNLLVANETNQWSFTFPILAERLRMTLEIDFERLHNSAISLPS